MLMQYNKEGESFLSRIVIADEMWLEHIHSMENSRQNGTAKI